MGILNFFSKISQRMKEDREEFRLMEREMRLKKRLEEKMKSPMQKELEFYQREKERERLNKMLELERKKRTEKLKKISNALFNPNAYKLNETNDLMKGNWRWT